MSKSVPANCKAVRDVTLVSGKTVRLKCAQPRRQCLGKNHFFVPTAASLLALRMEEKGA